MLDILAEINTIFQEKYGFVPFFWEYLRSLSAFLREKLREIERGDFGDFPFLRNLERPCIGQFSMILKCLIVNLSVRFYDVSASLNKAQIKGFLDYEHVQIRPDAPVGARPVCGVDKLLDVFSMEFGLAAQHLQGPLFHLGLQIDAELFGSAEIIG